MTDKIRILYIDGDPALLEITKQYFEQDDGLIVTTVKSAADALYLHIDKPFDVIVSGDKIPEMDGIELLKQIREKGDTTPFIIFTGEEGEDAAIEALNSGADFYQQKGGQPALQFRSLSNKIHHAVFHRRAEREVLRKNTELQAAYEHIHVTEEKLRSKHF